MKKLFLFSVVIVLMIYVVNALFKETVNNYKFDFNENIYVRVKRNSDAAPAAAGAVFLRVKK